VIRVTTMVCAIQPPLQESSPAIVYRASLVTSVKPTWTTVAPVLVASMVMSHLTSVQHLYLRLNLQKTCVLVNSNK